MHKEPHLPQISGEGLKLAMHAALVVASPIMYIAQGIILVMVFEMQPGYDPPASWTFILFWLGLAARTSLVGAYFFFMAGNLAARVFAVITACSEALMMGIVASLMTGHAGVKSAILFFANDFLVVAASILVLTSCVYALFPHFARRLGEARHGLSDNETLRNEVMGGVAVPKDAK